MPKTLEYHSTQFATSNRDFRFSNSDANSYCINKHFYYVPHRHSEYFDWIYVVEGELLQIINGRRYVLGPGDMAWIRPGDWHEESGHDMKFFVMCGTIAWLESIMAFMQLTAANREFHRQAAFPQAHVPEDMREQLTAKWERCWKVQLGSTGRCYAIELVAEVFSEFFLPQVDHIMQQVTCPQWFSNAMNYIQNHVGEEISSELLADVCDKSPEHVARSFQTYMDCTPSQYINRTRLHYAARLLVTTNMPIIEVSMAAGFGSLGHFYRLFKQRFNHSPRSYRMLGKT